MYAVTFVGESIILTGYGALAAWSGRTAASHHAVWRERISGLVLLSLGIAAAFAGT
jgi:threonine/homoserine/homoserine lactone efflux protein